MIGSAEELFFLYGDSITQQGYSQDDGFGWVAALSNAYIRKLSVINCGLSGYSTDKALAKLPSVVPSPNVSKIRFLVIFFGANDSRLPNTPQPEQHVPLYDYKQNLKALAMHDAVRAHKPHIILVTPPPIDEQLCEAEDQSKGIRQVRRQASITAKYAQAAQDVVVELAPKIDIALLDLWSAFMSYAGWKKDEPLLGAKSTTTDKNGLSALLKDGLHLTGQGNRLVFNELLELVRSRWPEDDPEKLSFILPYWADEEAWKGN